MEQVPRIGVSVSICKEGKVLLGHRKGEHGKDTWAVPGGHLDFGETLEACAKREVLEETGLVVNDVRKGVVTEDFFKETGKHYVTFHMISNWTGGEPRICEPDKCSEWKWISRTELPEHIFLPYKNALDSGFDPFNM